MTDNVRVFEPKSEKCPNCGNDLSFDIHDRRYHCKVCGTTWNRSIDMEKEMVAWHECPSEGDGMMVYFEPTGWTGARSILSVFVNPQEDGSGFHFSPDGELHQYKWARPHYARRFHSSVIPEPLWYSIQHGIEKVSVPEEKTDTWTWNDVEYDRIDPEWVEAMLEVKQRIDDVKTPEEFAELYPLIKKSHVISHKVMDKLFSFYGLPDVPVHNGEIGIAALQKMSIYEQLLIKAGLETVESLSKED